MAGTLAQGCQPPCKDVKLSHFFFNLHSRSNTKLYFNALGATYLPVRAFEVHVNHTV